MLGWASTTPAESAAEEISVQYNAAQARGAVESFHATLIDALRTPSQQAREVLLTPQIDRLFHIRRISQISLGRTWRTLSAEQQHAFNALLSQLIVATYADRFAGYSGQKFVTDEVQPVKSGFVVQTRLVRETGADVSLHYFLREGRIFNVVADGVSDLSLRRADYNSIIKNQGYELLLVHIEQKLAQARTEE